MLTSYGEPTIERIGVCYLAIPPRSSPPNAPIFRAWIELTEIQTTQKAVAVVQGQPYALGKSSQPYSLSSTAPKDVPFKIPMLVDNIIFGLSWHNALEGLDS